MPPTLSFGGPDMFQAPAKPARWQRLSGFSGELTITVRLPNRIAGFSTSLPTFSSNSLAETGRTLLLLSC